MTVRLGLVGCGRLAEHGYAPAAGLARGVVLAAIADPDPERRGLVAGLAGGEVAMFEDASALLAGADLDAVVLATPAALHLADAERAVAAGLPVLVEKPPAPDAAGAAALARLGDGVRVGFNRRFDAPVAALRQQLPTGPLDLHLSIAYRRASWSAHTVRDEVLLDLVPHLADRARWLSGSEPVTVVAEELHPDRAVLSVALGRGRARLVAAADRMHEERVEARDAAGVLVARHRVGGPVGAVLGRARTALDQARGRSAPHPLAASLAAQLEAFAAAVRGEPAGELATAADGVAAMAVVDAARASAASGGAPVPVPDLREQRTC